MPRARNERRKQKIQCKLASFSDTKPRSSSMVTSNDSHATESRNLVGKNSKKKKMLLFVKFRGLGCKGTSLPASTPAIIRSAADWESKQTGKERNRRRKRKQESRRNPGNVVVDVPDVCCTPPGVGIASDFAPRTRTNAPRIDHRKHPREARRNEDTSGPNFPAILSSSRTNHGSAGEIIETLMSQQRILHGQDRYQDWRLNVDDMSYEELLDLSDTIGYVGSGLREEEISRCLRRFKQFNPEKDWKCSICQEKYRRDGDVVTLDCGHHHHVRCIKQWLLQKNDCPVCKSPALPGKSR
ncbi:putative E3 ubiquitin-protein ligase HIP1 [Sesamum angolense]|uniref:RING-type E3 ubiquitin transferase n=1 Tax=Sesamum angolense TaxID=2727404 RepID=A0AAE2BW69_9LAMI|nr:putative E3 ubiquitin-protein ligase HIP1 [Sesamum angolense]